MGAAKKATKKAAKQNAGQRATLRYALEQLFRDQDADYVTDCIAPVLAWVPGKSKAKSRQPFVFPVDDGVGGETKRLMLELTWDEAALEQRIPGLKAHVQRLETRTSPQREHITELAAYGLALVAVSTLLPGRRVVGFNDGAAPDILLDVTPGALRGWKSRDEAGAVKKPCSRCVATSFLGSPSARTSPRLIFRCGARQRGTPSWNR